MAKIYSIEHTDPVDEVKVQRVVVDLSPTLLIGIALILGVYFFGKQLLSISLLLMLGFVFMSITRKSVLWLMKKNVSKGWAVFLSYLLLILFIVAVISIIIVPFVNQIGEFIKVLPVWVERVFEYIKNISIGGRSINISTDSLKNSILDIFKKAPSIDNVKSLTTFLGGFFGAFATFITSLILSMYLVLEHDSFLELLLIRFRSKEKRERIKKLVVDVEDKLGNWVVGQGVVSLISMLFSGLMLTVLKVPFAVPLAVFVGLMGAIPTFGTTLASLLMALAALVTIGPAKALLVVVIYALYQQIENNLIIPKVMGGVVGLKPVIIMLEVIILIMLFGPIGGLIAIPAMVVGKIMYEFYIDLQKLEAKGIV